MSFYSIMFHAHSGLRWLILLLAVVLVVKSLIGLFGGGKYSKLDNILSASFVGFMHTQLLLGIYLYFTSSLVKTAFLDFGAAMKDSELRFWSVEHISVMILAIVAAQGGRSIMKRASDDSVKFRFQAIFFGVSLLLMLFAIPWDRLG